MVNKILFSKLKEAFVSVLPVCLIVVLVNFSSATDFSFYEMLLFGVCGICLIIGIGLFNLGADMAMSPMGEFIGAGIAKSKNLLLMIIVCFVMGVFVTVAEPDLSVLASQLESAINPTTLIFSVAVGVGIFLVFAVLKIVFKKELSSLLFFFYLMLFAFSNLVIINGNDSLLALSFDSGGVTTGPITVPFIMALGLGIASSFGGKNSAENSFGMIALCSVGPIIAVMILAVGAKGGIAYELPDYSINVITKEFIFNIVTEIAADVIKAVLLIFVFFEVLNVWILRIPRRKVLIIVRGIVFTVVGLVIFLSAVNIGFMPIGYKLGKELALTDERLLIFMGFVFGAVVVLAEPAVHVLNHQVEDVTKGLVSKKSMMIALCSGVGISLGLSMVRIVYSFSILYYLIPGYLISLGLSMFVPKVYTGIAFDSGGVASGPLTSSFILPFAIGACVVCGGEESVLYNGFGIVSMVAMTPLITIQLLGFSAIYRKRLAQKRAIKKIYSDDDKRIIRFR